MILIYKCKNIKNINKIISQHVSHENLRSLIYHCPRNTKLIQIAYNAKKHAKNEKRKKHLRNYNYSTPQSIEKCHLYTNSKSNQQKIHRHQTHILEHRKDLQTKMYYKLNLIYPNASKHNHH